MEAEEDDRREASISSAPSLQPDFKPEKTSITQTQLSKFQELHRRRLQIKNKSKINTKSKGRVDGMRKPVGRNKLNDEGCVGEKSSEDASFPLAECSAGNGSSSQEDGVAMQMMATKRQKLHWAYSFSPFENQQKI